MTVGGEGNYGVQQQSTDGRADGGGEGRLDYRIRVRSHLGYPIIRLQVRPVRVGSDRIGPDPYKGLDGPGKYHRLRRPFFHQVR